MEFEVVHPYEGSVAQVHLVKATAAFWQGKYELIGQRAVEVLECGELAPGQLRIRTKRDVPVAVPGFAKKVLSPHNTVIQTDTWAPAAGGDGREGQWTIEVVGRPIALSGTMALEPRGDQRCQERIRGTIKVSVPLVGGMIARFLVGDTHKQLEAEHAFTQRFLAEQLAG